MSRPVVFARTCAFAKASRSQWDYALAPAMRRRPGAGQRVTLNHPSAPPLRALAQFVSNAAARRLLAVTERFDRPVDTFLQMSWITGVELLTFTPSGVYEISERARRLDDSAPQQVRPGKALARAVAPDLSRAGAVLSRLRGAPAAVIFTSSGRGSTSIVPDAGGSCAPAPPASPRWRRKCRRCGPRCAARRSPARACGI